MTSELHVAMAVLAYIDPGSGSFILQVVVGTLLGASVALKMYWARLRAYFVSRGERNDGDADRGA
ncbi:MAG: hypothetical protein IPF53_22380 [Blastocatellia bacterium]|jgi:hypothetical protein|nr:hypothetical protein [Blastocatellia bacterium]MBK6426109.1 hypothetical protein [Blastocatellia bacterium]